MPRCPKGTRKNKKTGECDSHTTRTSIKRCPKGTRKNKKTGDCETYIKSILQPTENIETTCNINKTCESCTILPNTTKSKLKPPKDEIEGYTIGNHFTICNFNLETSINEEGLQGVSSKRLAKNISLDGIMIIIVDLHGGLDLPIEPINPDSFTTTNIASISAAPPGLSNVALPGFTREMHEHYINTGIKERIEGLVKDNLQKIEDIAPVPDGKLNKKVEIANRKKMSSVSPDLCVLMLNELRQSVKESFAESFSRWRRDSPHARVAQAFPDERYRSVNIIKGFGVDPDVASLPYKKYVTYHDKNDEHHKMGVTTMTFRINKNNKVTCGKKFTPADNLMPLIEHHKQTDPAGGSIHFATMEKLINHFTGNAKTPPETVVAMDLTCSNLSDGRLLTNPLASYRKLHGGCNKKRRINEQHSVVKKSQ